MQKVFLIVCVCVLSSLVAQKATEVQPVLDDVLLKNVEALAAKECMNNNPRYKTLFIMLLIMNYVLWAKVATDLFCVFALFLMLDPSIQEEEPNTNLTTVEQ